MGGGVEESNGQMKGEGGGKIGCTEDRGQGRDDGGSKKQETSQIAMKPNASQRKDEGLKKIG